MGSVVGALLGPERTGLPFRGVVVVLQGRLGLVPLVVVEAVVGWRGRVTGVWLLVENCTVDASIF